MYLKRVVLDGFKSFADRTEFDFGPGITGIVGPNGCGKSNVVDAVKWVLGEQSAKSLRGRKMLDVIFMGGGGRPPANSAEVELVFDNTSRFLGCDEADVHVSRTLYRSGESEYRLNGKACRLKDIRELLLDTGVAVGAYSIIEQGRVDVLLQANPVQRREIFEEAAGISRYRMRRVEAQRKLERTQNNLLRLNDILEELERRLRSVKLQAGKARNFQEYDARLRELRSSFALAEYHQLEQQRESLAARAEAFEQELAAIREELAGKDSEAAGVEQELRGAEEQLRGVEERLARLQSEVSALAERRVQCERRIVELAETRDRREAQAVGVGERIATLQQRITEEEQTLERLAGDAEQHDTAIGELRSRRSEAQQQCDGSRGSLEKEKSAAFDAVRRATLLHNQQANLDQQRERLGREIERRTQRHGELTDEQNRLREQRTALTADVEAAATQSETLSSDVRTADERREQLSGRLATQEAAITDAKERRAGVVSRLSVLEDMERRHEGVDKGALEVLKLREQEGPESNVVGLVADVLRIDDPRVAALQPVLSQIENFVVVRDGGAFFDALDRRSELPGPVRVMALDRVPAAPPEHALDGVEGVVARAADWVICEEQHRPLAERLLGRVILTDSAPRALELSRNAPESFVFVAPDGRTVSGGGELTAGPTSTSGGLISRKAEIRQLRADLDEAETELERRVRERNALKDELADAEVQRRELVSQLAAAQKRHADAQGAVVRLDDQAGRIARELEIAAGEMQSLRSGLAEIADEKEKLSAQQQAADEEKQTHESKIGALERELAELEASLQRLSQELTEALVEAGRSNERRNASEQGLRELRRNIERLAAERDSAAREAQEALEMIERAKAELETTTQREQELTTEIESQRRAAESWRRQRDGLRERMEACSAAGRELHERIEAVEHALYEKQMALREIEVRKENLVTRVAEEFELDLLGQYADYEHAEQDWEAVKTEIDELRKKIQRLGNVNLDAIDELEELTPRFENMQTQRQDLVEAIERLEKLIEELDEESRARFVGAFADIREQFQDLFRKLFGGGKADIILEDPENPLECGIEIIARPPGKEAQSISLLSGGEKTMTAVALLLAVFKSRPSPFAILDEVDAALDESNVGRFNNVIREFLAHSQFVIITHNKRTMQGAGVLYGVTMEEKGVSKRVSVRFDDRVDTPIVA